MKNRKLNFWGLTCVFAFCLFIFNLPAYGQATEKIAALEKRIIEAKTYDEACVNLEELKGAYFQGGRYSDFVASLNSLLLEKKDVEPCINYYIELSRYSQLKSLEEKESWDEYFSRGNEYRQELTAAADKAIAGLKLADPLAVSARLILWQFHKDQQDAFAENSLEDLVNAVKEYAKEAKDTKPIKEAADKLAACGEKGKSRGLYRLYAEKIIASGVKTEELANIAANFYKEENLELAENIYDAYIERLAKEIPQDKLASLLTDIAWSFAYKNQGPSDPLYAEKIFQKLEESGGKEAFSEELIYQRALNLEKAKEYKQAAKFYRQLVELMPASLRAPEANFKLGIIYVYVLRDLENGRGYFERVTQKETANPYFIAGLYQLGLLSQWQDNAAAAKDYYNKLLEKAGENFAESTALARERLKEIEEAKPLDYNLKFFLDLSLKEEGAMFDMSKLELKSQPSIAPKDAEIKITSAPYIPQSGCMQVEVDYLWSGNTGTKKPTNSEAVFSTTFTEPGTKVVNLAVISPGGVIDRSLEMVDVQ